MAFNSRNWEFSSQITNDLTDFLTPRIRVDQFSGKIYRVLPTVEWISNKIRFLYLGLKNQRIVSPLFSYQYVIKIELTRSYISYKKLLILTNRLEKAFSLLKKRLANTRKKNVNVVLGAVFDANINLFYAFEKINTKIKKHLEFSGNVEISKMVLSENNNYIFFGVNPRMESPALNLLIKENKRELFSIGNFSFQYNVSIIDNSSYSLIEGIKGKLLSDAIAFFGINSLKISESYMGKKNVILPIYYLSNLVNKSDNSKHEKNVDDVSIYLATQNLVEAKSDLAFAITTHFEKIKGTDKIVRIPVAGYLESNINYINSSLELVKINSIKPSFSFSDFMTAFGLFTKKKFELKTGLAFNFSFSLKKIVNKLINNTVPNYLVRDPLTRANQLFNKI